MFDTEIFKAVVSNKRVQVLVNGTIGIVTFNESNMLISDHNGDLVKSVTMEELEKTEINEDGSLMISDEVSLTVQEVTKIIF